MKFKLLIAVLLGASLTASAQGFKDGIEYYKAGQYDNAITILERNMNAAGTDKALANYYLGQAFLAKGDQAKAKSAFQAGLAADPQCAYNYVGIGAIDLKNGNAQAAKDNFKKAQDLAKKNAEVLVDIARAYYNADPAAYDKQITEFIAKAHKKSKDKEPAIYIFEGDRKAKAQDWNAAATQYEQAIYFDEDNPEGYVKYANVYFYIQPDYATGKLEELLAKQPNSALAQRELAEKYYQSGKWTRAAQQYGKYIDNPNHFPEDKARYAVLLYAGDNYGDAARVSREVLANDPNNFQAERVLVQSLIGEKKEAEALAAAKTFMNKAEYKGRFNANDYTSFANLLLADSVTAPEALVVLEDGLKALPTSADILNGISDYYFAQKDFAQAAEYGEKAISNMEKPSASDLYNGATTFWAASASALAAKEAEKSVDFAKRGLALLNRALDGVALDGTPVTYQRRKAQLLTLANGGVPDQAAFDAWNDLLKRMDMDPKYADPANSDNRLSFYADAWSNIAKFNAAQGNNEGTAAANEKVTYYDNLSKGVQ